jgi:hypothetical protein
MTQFGEPIKVGLVTIGDEPPCPFDHDGPPKRNKKNILIGKGSKLASKMKQGKKTDLYDKGKTSSVENPRYINEHSFYSPGSLKDEQKSKKKKENWPVTVKLENNEEEKLPVRCAAHHIIPAQESLKLSKLREFMVKKNSPEKLKDETFSEGKVWCDVGYDVNGAENGVFLPGSYAVGGGRGGLKKWDTTDDSDEDDEDNDSDNVDPEKFLTGSPSDITEDTPKWQYIRQAMLKCPGQFHDRHEMYSKFILKKLDALALLYKSRYEKYEQTSDSPCEKCNEKKKRWKDDGYPTPTNLITKLNSISNQVCGFINGTKWAQNIYTSKWVLAYMKKRAAGRKWAKI